jgi:transposase
MIVEALIAGMSLVGCVGCWAAVQKHRIVAEMQKDKLKHDLEVLKPTSEPLPPPRVVPPSPPQQALTALLERRETLENQILDLRKRISEHGEGRFTQYRADALKALEDAREEQQELVLEETGLLEMMQESKPRQLRVAPQQFNSGSMLFEVSQDEELDAEERDEQQA